MSKISVNKFNVLEFDPKKINEINDKDRYFDVYLTYRGEKRELIAEMKINLSNDLQSKLSIIKKGDLLHPKVLLAMNSFMSSYKE